MEIRKTGICLNLDKFWHDTETERPTDGARVITRSALSSQCGWKFMLMEYYSHDDMFEFPSELETDIPAFDPEDIPYWAYVDELLPYEIVENDEA